jgi:hypothetical protein
MTRSIRMTAANRGGLGPRQALRTGGGLLADERSLVDGRRLDCEWQAQTAQ